MATYSVSSTATWNTAKASAVSGDTILFTSDVTGTAADSAIAAGVTVDLGGHNVTIAESTAHRGWIPAGGVTIRNGTIGGCRYPIWNWYGGTNFVLQDLYIVGGVVTAIKLAAANTIEAANVLIERVDVTADATIGDLTTVDLGPGPCRDVTLRDLKVVRTGLMGNSTSADTIAIEQAYGTTTLERVYASGAAGDGIDLKNFGNISLTDVEVGSARRNGIKVWGHPDTTATWLRCKCVNAGYDSMNNAGTYTVTDSYFEGGNLPGSAWYGGPTDPSRLPPHFGPAFGTFTNCVFQGVAEAGLVCIPTNIYPSTAEFYDCTFYQPLHPNIVWTYGGPDSGIVLLKQNVDKPNPVWPARYHNCTYATASQPVPLNPPLAPGTPAPDTGPTAGTLTVSAIETTQFTASMSAGVAGSNPITRRRLAVYGSAANRTADTAPIYDQDISADTPSIVAGLTDETTYYVRACWIDSAARSATRDTDVTTDDIAEPPVDYAQPTCTLPATGAGYVGVQYQVDAPCTSDYLTATGGAVSDATVTATAVLHGTEIGAAVSVSWPYPTTRPDVARLTFTPTDEGVWDVAAEIDDGWGTATDTIAVTVTTLTDEFTAIARALEACSKTLTLSGGTLTLTLTAGGS